MQVAPTNVKRILIEYETDYILGNRWRNISTLCISGIYIATLLRNILFALKPTNLMVNFNFLLLLQVNTGVVSILHPFLSIISRLSYH